MNSIARIPKRVICLLLLIIISASFFAVLDRQIANSLPYPRHIDERHRLDRAAEMLGTGDFSTHYFYKPTFPIYLTAAGLAYGFLKEAKKGNIKTVDQIGRTSYPYFTHPQIVQSAKQLFLLIAAMALLLTAVSAYKAFRFPPLLFLPAVFIAVSDTYLQAAAVYINVNIVGALSVSILLCYLMYTCRQKGAIEKAVVPGILCGMTIACKYNFLMAYLPALLAVAFYERRHFLSRSILLLFVSVVTFFILNPFIITNLDSFLNDTAFDLYHYLEKGHTGYQEEPGLPQFYYHIMGLVDQFGFFAVLYSLFGLLYMFRLDYKKTIVLISFPLAMLFMMSASKANFMRNLIPAYMVWSIVISMGVIGVYRFLKKLLSAYSGVSRKLQALPVFIVSMLPVLFTLPYSSLLDAVNSQTDSRNQVTVWLQDNAEPGSTLFIPSDLAMDYRLLLTDFTVVPFNFRGLSVKHVKELFAEKDYYILLPAYGLDNRFKGKALVRHMQKMLAEFVKQQGLQPVKLFGDRPVLLNYQRTVPKGNPEFYLARRQTS